MHERIVHCSRFPLIIKGGLKERSWTISARIPYNRKGRSPEPERLAWVVDTGQRNEMMHNSTIHMGVISINHAS